MTSASAKSQRSGDEPRGRGLAAVEAARAERAKLRFPAPKFFAWAGVVLAAMGILHWKRTQGELEGERQKLLARQRAVAVELKPKWDPLRDKIEGWTTSLAASAAPEVVDKEAFASWDFREKPGIYLRLVVDQATTAESIRAKAKDSLRDGFTACLTRAPNENPLAGKECKRTRDCPSGEFCNEVDHCARPAQPYNLRVAYRTLHVLTDRWVADAQEASNDVRLRLLTASFDDAVLDDLPMAVDLLTRAQYFLLVLDERPAGVPMSATAEEVQKAPHAARLGLWRLSDGKQVFRGRRETAADLVGGMPAADPESLDARQRQANSCALALALRDALGDPNVGAAP